MTIFDKINKGIKKAKREIEHVKSEIILNSMADDLKDTIEKTNILKKATQEKVFEFIDGVARNKKVIKTLTIIRKSVKKAKKVMD